jgi:hypothetical protein
MKSINFILALVFLTMNVIFAEGNQEANRTIIQGNANYRELLHVFYKGTRINLTDEVVINYIKDFYENDYNYRQNEFEWPSIMDKRRSELASSVSNANLTNTYTFQTGARLGNYNFDRGGFDVSINMEYLFLTKRGLSVGDGTIYPDVASKGILIFINSINGFNFVKMDRNEANAFINSRTKNGSVDRNITLHISFGIDNFFPDTGIFLIAQSNNSVSARITKVDVYDGPKKIGELVQRPTISLEKASSEIYINDLSGLLAPETVKNIAEKGKSFLFNEGVHLAFAITSTTENKIIDDYSLDLYYKLNVGKESNDNGILFVLLISSEYSNWYLRWGNGSVIQAVGGENILNTVRRLGGDFSIYSTWDIAIMTIYNGIMNMF